MGQAGEICIRNFRIGSRTWIRKFEFGILNFGAGFGGKKFSNLSTNLAFGSYTAHLRHNIETCYVGVYEGCNRSHYHTAR